MTRLYELAFAVTCLPAAIALVWTLAVTCAMWLIRAVLRIPGVRPYLAATARLLLPEPRPREVHVCMGVIKTLLSEFDDALDAFEDLSGRFRDLCRRLCDEFSHTAGDAEPAGPTPTAPASQADASTADGAVTDR